MNKKVVVLSGSPRKNGNSFAMTDAFVKACEERGFEVIRFDSAFMNVKGCTACGSCYKNDKACSQKDDFNEIAAAIEVASAVVFSCPVYWYGVPAQLKAVIDKFYAFVIGGKLDAMRNKKTALITCWEESGLDVSDGVKATYRGCVGLMGWSIVGEVLIPGVYDVGAVHQTDGIAQAIKLADLL